jgi:hydroxyethylthiazole kinase-like uncharacterized protein yjeF
MATVAIYRAAMLPVVSPDEMAEIDARATVAVEVLIERAGRAVAREALALLGGSYGRRVAVVVGKGNNGNDGRVAATALAGRGVAVRVIDAAAPPAELVGYDLVIDAAYGTGFRGVWSPPAIGPTPVLAVDIPSGIDGLTGRAEGPVWAARRTVTMVAHKPGLLLEPGRHFAGSVTVADIGLAVERARTFLLEPGDVAAIVPRRGADAHKWRAAVSVVAGSPGMTGAAVLAAGAAQRSGAGMVRLGVPGADPTGIGPVEVVGRPLSTNSWAAEVLADLDRIHALVIGPGLGRSDATGEAVRRVVAGADVPVVVDGDGLVALAWSPEGAAAVLKDRAHPAVLTPHDGEFALLRGARIGSDRLGAARSLAHDLRSVVLLKGPTTIVADPRGRVLIVDRGDARLATAGTGDVLSGVVGALLAQGLAPFEAAACGAWLHAEAARLGMARGLIASDVVALLPAALAGLP